MVAAQKLNVIKVAELGVAALVTANDIDQSLEMELSDQRGSCTVTVISRLHESKVAGYAA